MVRPHLVVVDIGGLGRLLGTPREIGEAFCRIARERGLIVAVGIASTQTAALLLALHQATTARVASASDASVASVELRGAGEACVHAACGSAERGGVRAHAHADADRLTVVRPGREAAALAPLPLSLLAVLPSDRLTNDDVAFLRRRPDPSSSIVVHVISSTSPATERHGQCVIT